MTQKRASALVAIDFPKRNEKVQSEHYTLRLTAHADGAVEISIDGEGWQPCRPAVGHWWYDWSGYGPGRHEVLARLRGPDGSVSESGPVSFRVAFQGADEARSDGRLEQVS